MEVRAALVALILAAALPARGGEVSLRYTYREETAAARLLADETLVDLADVARFYGLSLKVSPATGLVVLHKGGREARFLLGGAFFAGGSGTLARPLDPVRRVEGRLAATPEAARDLLRAILNINVTWVPEKRVLVAGGVSEEDVLREILDEVEKRAKTPVPVPTPPPSLRSTPSPAPRDRVGEDSAQQYHVAKVVLDAGHGGNDAGARGYSGKYYEKEANLDITLRVKEYLERAGGVQVLLTRHRDQYVSLKERTAFANRNGADLFVSIHCNANRRRDVSGTETYVYSSRASTEQAARAASRENAETDFLDFVQADLRHNAYRARSYLLAEKIDQRIRDRLGQKIRRIEQAPFYVLARVDMPSVLIETAFLSHPKEEAKLKDPKWRDRIARAIADGILAYKEHVEGAYERRRVGG